MSRIKGRYVAQIILNLEAERTKDTLPFEEIKKEFKETTDEITKTLKTNFEVTNGNDFCKITVIPQFSDVYEIGDKEDYEQN